MISTDDLIAQLLIALSRSCSTHHDDVMDALQFTNDPRYPMHETTRQIAWSIRREHDYFSDSTVDDLLDDLHHILHADADSDTCAQCTDELR